MTLTDIGNAAGETAHAAVTPRPREPFVSSATAAPSAVLGPLVAQPVVALGDAAAETLLDAIRRGLAPGDPVARLLAGWTAPPTRAVAVTRTVRGDVRGPARCAAPDGARSPHTPVDEAARPAPAPGRRAASTR